MPYSYFIRSSLLIRRALTLGLCGWWLCISLFTVPVVIEPDGRRCLRSADHPHPVSLVLSIEAPAAAELEGECDAEAKEDISLKKLQDYLHPDIFRHAVPDPNQVYYLHEMALISWYVSPPLLMPPEA